MYKDSTDAIPVDTLDLECGNANYCKITLTYKVDRVKYCRGAISIEARGRDNWVVQSYTRIETEKWLAALRKLAWLVWISIGFFGLTCFRTIKGWSRIQLATNIFIYVLRG